ncbi:hypothetical protein QBC40DRAFT_4430 [Triangularia verruculosa]|uniref:DUF3669 domain-containing protein n=1 Tax=Triangularia verruculosa TaxID=2587418 RepID=A0AAN6XFK2_9PEZI|nr:hypothetical protein QBC40DRAFT_4430 [Triangularia verruculosa]
MGTPATSKETWLNPKREFVECLKLSSSIISNSTFFSLRIIDHFVQNWNSNPTTDIMEHSQHQQSQQLDVDVDTALRNALTLRRRPPQGRQNRDSHHQDQRLLPLRVSLPASTTPFVKIGAGTCGAVFAQPQSPLAFKLCKTTKHTALLNDYFNHHRIYTVFTSSTADVFVPEPHYFVFPGHKAWAETHSSLLTTASEFVNLPTPVLVSERIPPVPAHIRHLLIDKFCPESAKEAARNDPANNDCLIRVYLGSMLGKSKEARQLPVFSLRNFNLHLNQMAEIGLDYEVLARRIGYAMALLHIRCRNDAGDVEFVLGGKPTTRRSPRALPTRFTKRDTGPESCRDEDLFQAADQVLYPDLHDDDEVALWLLDFNRVRSLRDPGSIISSEVGANGEVYLTARKASGATYFGPKMVQTVKAARENDPYCPRYGPPSQEWEQPLTVEERKAWKAFQEGYEEIENKGYNDDVRPSDKPKSQFLDIWKEVPRRLLAKWWGFD